MGKDVTAIPAASYAVLHVSRRSLLAPDYTIKQYTNFKRLQRYYDLKAKTARSAEEESLMNELKADPSISQYAS